MSTSHSIAFFVRETLTPRARWLSLLLLLVLVPVLVGAREARRQRTWLKCQFHCHTTLSDGVMTSDEVLAAYASLGYDVLAVTDHDLWSLGGLYEGMLLIPGNEISQIDHHCVTLGTMGKVEQVRILAHPALTGLTPARFTELMQDYDAWEIYNAMAEFMLGNDGNHPRIDQSSSSVYRIYTSRPAIASDDSHGPGMIGRTITWLFARKEEGDVLDAIRKGRIRTELRPAE
jgi:hypothetical protein